jgi:hypothetical protein
MQNILQSMSALFSVQIELSRRYILHASFKFSFTE